MAPSSKIPVSISILSFFCLSVLIISTHFDLAQAAPAQNSSSVSISSSTERNSNLLGEERGGLFEGDMILPEIQSLKVDNQTDDKTTRWRRSGRRDTSLRWPNAVVTYELDSDFSRREVNIIRGAMKEISAKSCVQFRPTIKRDSKKVRIVRGAVGSGCFSQVGFRGDIQEINLEPETLNSPNYCIEHDTVLHELLHTLGFHHEQSRTDRDKWITINTDNIEAHDYKKNFKKYDADLITDFNIPYDYQSIMHYEANAFAIDPSIPTIIPKVPNVKIGPGKKLTEMDAMKINAMYSKSNGRCQRKLASLKSGMRRKSKVKKSLD